MLLLLLSLQGEAGFRSEEEEGGYCDKTNKAQGYNGERAFQTDSPWNYRRHCFSVCMMLFGGGGGKGQKERGRGLLLVSERSFV